MNIALRKQKILAAVIENYIATGEPIGSKSLMDTEELNVSSATIRNELADLTAKGFLFQPHTSAGRIPTELGWRYYVENLMEPKTADARVRNYIDSRLSYSCEAPEEILKTAAATLSELSDTAALASTPSGEDARVHRLRFVQTGRNTSMVVLITSSGMVKSRLFRCDFNITPEMLNVFDRALNEKLMGQPLSFVNRAFAQSFAASFGELGLLMPDMLLAVMNACVEAAGTNVYTAGSSKLLYHSDLSPIYARATLELLSDNSRREKLLTDVPEGTNIYIGAENPAPELRQSALITSRYTIYGETAGALALLSPLRCDYPKIVPVIEYTSKVVGELIEELVTERR